MKLVWAVLLPVGLTRAASLPPGSVSSEHGCDQAAGQVWCGDRCAFPLDAGQQLTCLPPRVVEALAGDDGFAWGAATAAYQIEGGVAEDGRGSSIWDTFAHEPGHIAHGDTGDVADDHFHKWREDVQLVRSMGLSHYRFSVAWPRVVPKGRGEVNQAGLRFYSNLIDELQRQGIEPMVTLYHWDLPQALEDEGGWLNPATADAFVEYARTVFAALGDRVRLWLTFNEPHTFIRQGYSEGVFAPGRCSDRTRCLQGDSATEPYLVAHHVLLAHAQAVEVYRTEFQATQRGEIGLTLNVDYGVPADPANPADVAAAQRYEEFQLGWFADPIVFGRYPTSMVNRLGDRLPAFTPAQTEQLRGSHDFFAMNFYTSYFVRDLADAPLDPSLPFWTHDADCATDGFNPQTGDAIGLQGESPWLFSTPQGFRNMLHWVNDRYSPTALFITENGCSAPHESSGKLPNVLHDKYRLAYYFEYLDNLAAAVLEGVPVRGYFAWSLLDNFEWADGYQMRFGLHYVDFTDPTLPRYPKDSALWFTALLQQLHDLATTTTTTSSAQESATPGAAGSQPAANPLLPAGLVAAVAVAVAAAAAIVLLLLRHATATTATAGVARAPACTTYGTASVSVPTVVGAWGDGQFVELTPLQPQVDERGGGSRFSVLSAAGRVRGIAAHLLAYNKQPPAVRGRVRVVV